MGMFDTVEFYCPGCGEKIPLQTKAGKCRLTVFSGLSVPRVVAQSLDKTAVQCARCHVQFTLHVQPPPERVVMYLVPRAE